MTKIITSLVLALTIVSGAATANAGYGNAQAEKAEQHQITPHGVFDAR